MSLLTELIAHQIEIAIKISLLRSYVFFLGHEL